jgi:hypothetical protein
MSNTDPTKNTTQKTKKMSNTDPTKTTTQKAKKMIKTDPTKTGGEPRSSRRLSYYKIPNIILM